MELVTISETRFLEDLCCCRIWDRKLRKSRGNFIDEDKNGFLASQLSKSQIPEAILYSSFRDNPTAGWATFSFGGDLTLPLERALKQIMKEMIYSGIPPDPSSGLILPMVLLFSGHCTKIGIFGISSSMGPRYWEMTKRNQKRKLNPKNHLSRTRNLSANHNTELEALLWKKIEKFDPSFRNAPTDKDVYIRLDREIYQLEKALNGTKQALRL
ncbi:unnamed protein product [Bathycoccus prasinos]